MTTASAAERQPLRLDRTSSTVRPRRRPLRTAVVTIVAFTLLALVPAPARARTIEELRAEANRLAAELEEARDRLDVLGEEYLQATADREAALAEQAAAESALEATRAEAELRSAELAEYAITAYIGGGSLADVEGLFSSRANEAGQRLSYLGNAAGNRRQLLEGLRSSRQALEGRIRTVDAARARADEQLARLEAAQAEATEVEAAIVATLDATKGELATLLAEAEERRRAEEAAAAAAAAGRVSDGGSSRVTVPPGLTPAVRPEAGVAVNAALSQLGVPYVFGGASPSRGFDCSGLMYWAWAQAGVWIPRPADYQRDEAIPISFEQLEPGDLVFYGEPVSHVSMYIGNELIVDAPQIGDVVQVKTMWYSRKPMTYGRVG
ncbi:MAG: hypothetical protein FJW83_01810 [Actinobacteria bacterium]|nr:hypothetical protein [Actinomycetota bacterium]